MLTRSRMGGVIPMAARATRAPATQCECANICSMPTFRYTVVEHDPDRPWIIVGDTRHLTVDLEDASDFPGGVTRHWPRDRFTTELEAGQEEPRLRF